MNIISRVSPKHIAECEKFVANFMKKIKNILSFQINFVPFVLWFTGWMFLSANILNIQKFIPWFNFKNQLDYLGLLAFFVLAYAIFLIFFLIIAHKKTIKFMAILLCILSTITIYFIDKYDVSIDRTMIMNALYTDKSEVKSLLSFQMIPFIIFFGIIPIFIISRTTIIFPKKYFLKSLKIIAIAIIIAVPFGLIKYNSLHLATNLSRKKIIFTVVPTNYIRSSLSVVSHTLIEPYFSKKAKNIQVEGKIKSTEDLIVVLAIGETSRQKNFSLYGYERNTNPLLSQDKKIIALNGKARIGSTLYALPEILVKKDIPLTAITSKLGIETSCFVNYSLYDNCAIPGEIKVENCKYKEQCYDEDTLPYLQKSVNEYKGGFRFIVLHIGGGSHGPSYHERYPKEFQKFTPICKDADVVNKCSPQELYNTFDNTILYVDYVVSNIIKTLDKSKKKFVFFYLSDHGESLLENGRIFHGMPPGMYLPEEQARIPLLIKSSIPISIKKQNEYSQQEIFDTILELFNIETAVADRNKSFIKKNNSK